MNTEPLYDLIGQHIAHPGHYYTTVGVTRQVCRNLESEELPIYVPWSPGDVTSLLCQVTTNSIRYGIVIFRSTK